MEIKLRMRIIFLFYIVAGLLSFLAVLFFIRPFSRKDDTGKKQIRDEEKVAACKLCSQSLSGEEEKFEDAMEFQTSPNIERQGVDEKGKTLGSRSDSVRMDNEKEDKEISPNDMQENLLRSNPPTDDTVKRQKGDQGKSTGSTLDSGFNPVKMDGTNDNDNESSKVTMESLEKKVPITEKSSESTSCSGDVQVISANDGVFGDDLESLQRKSSVTIDQDREHSESLYYYLDKGSMTIKQKVLTDTITKITEKSVEKLLDDERNRVELEELLPAEFHSIIKSKDRATSIYVLYGLHRIFLDEEDHPKSGWGNPIRSKDTGIGDDVERLHRIQNIVREISNSVTVSMENYIRLLDIMIEALTRLDRDEKFKKDLTDLEKEIACYKKYL